MNMKNLRINLLNDNKKYLTLYQNFYEDRLTPDAVKQGVKAIKQFPND